MRRAVLLVALGAALVTSSNVLALTIDHGRAHPRAAWITEDDPRWDCALDGNRSCGAFSATWTLTGGRSR